MITKHPLTVDLHSHSTCSDGALAPADLVAEAAKRGIGTLALTDHDTVAGLDEAEAAAAAHGITLVPGVEITCECAGTEIHVLGLGIDRRNSALLSLCDEIQTKRRDRFYEMVELLRRAGVPLSTESVPDGMSLARPMLARLLVQQGHADGYNDAFERYLRKGGPAYLPHRRTPIQRALGAIHAAGGVASVAHPGLYRNGDDVIHEAAQLGIDAIECYHSDHRHDVQEHFIARARKLSLLVTGGADYHGPEHARSVMFGKRSLPTDHWDKLAARMGG